MAEQEQKKTSITDLSAGSGGQENRQPTGSEAARPASGDQGASNKTSENTSENKSKDTSEKTSDSGSVAASAAETVKSTAQDVLAKAKDSAGQAYGFAAEKATSKIEEQKTVLSSGLSGVADSIRQVGKTFGESEEPNPVTDLTAKYGETLAGQIDNLSEYFESRDLREIVRDVETFARRQPVVFIGAAFAVGLLAARFLKSSGDGGSTQPSRQLNGHSSAAGNSRRRNQSNGQTAVDPS